MNYNRTVRFKLIRHGEKRINFKGKMTDATKLKTG